MLDLFISHSLDPSSAKPAWRPYRKPTAVSVPLHWTSAHNSAIHRSWPIAEVSRVRKLSCNDLAFQVAKRELLARWQEFGMHPKILAAAAAWTPHDTAGRQPVSSETRVVRITVDFHPALFNVDLKRELCNLNARWLPEIAPSWQPQIEVAWRGALRPLWLILRSNHL